MEVKPTQKKCEWQVRGELGRVDCVRAFWVMIVRKLCGI